MEKMKMHSLNLTQENVTRIREIFPGCVTEAQGEDGQLKLAVDFDLLRQELSEHIVEGQQERYHLNWPGKREAMLTANAPIAKILRPCREESVDFDTTGNLFIEGDNLDALKLLQETYLGKIKMIYIDPPYNTGNDFIYKDDFAESTDEFLKRSNQRDEQGNRLVANTEANGRFHSDWLSMMYPRLKIVRNLLKDDGVLFVSIDDGELSNIYKVCEEVFGNKSFVGNFIWKSRQTTDSRKAIRVSTDHEYVLCFAKNYNEVFFFGKDIDTHKYSNPDNDPRGPWASIDLTVQETKESRPNHFFDITDPTTGNVYPANPRRVWAKSKAVVDSMISDGRVLFPSESSGRPREKKFLNELGSDKTGLSTILNPEEVGYTRNGTKSFASLFDEKYFTFPKSIGMLRTLLAQTASSNAIVIDLFAGSCSFAEAVMQHNSSNGTNIRVISIQIPEPCLESSTAYVAGYKTIADIGKERIRRAGKKIKNELEILKAEKEPKENTLFSDSEDSPLTIDPSSLDIGFRVLKVDSSNMADVYYAPDATQQTLLDKMTDNIKLDRTAEDLLFQVLLDWGVDLSLPIKQQTIQGKTVFFVDDNALVACFDKGINEDLVKELARHTPLRVVFRDSGFVSDAVKINVGQIFKQMSPGTEVKSI
jgi:adenine-specific DNA-methyltransferase